MVACIIVGGVCFLAGMAVCAGLLHREIRLLGNLLATTTDDKDAQKC